MAIQRGSTPTHIFNTSVDLRDADAIYITYQQAGRTIVEKDKSDIEVFEDKVQVHLSQDDTLLFSTNLYVHIQVRAKFMDGTAIVSNIISARAGKLLKQGVI